jgi:DNA-binding response OmpR family regulator
LSSHRLQATWCCDLEHALSELAGGEYDAIVARLATLDIPSIGALALLREYARETSIFLLTECTDETLRREAVRVGARTLLPIESDRDLNLLLCLSADAHFQDRVA